MTVKRIHLYVLLNAVAAVLAMVGASHGFAIAPGIWGIAVLLFAGFLLEASASPLRGGEGKGSISFVTDLTAGLLFGAFWGGFVAALATVMSQIWHRRPPIRVVFNVAQRTHSSVLAIALYGALGGSQPLDYFAAGAVFNGSTFLWDILCFGVGTLAYFVVNSLVVSGALSLSSGLPLASVWRHNTLWVLGYDLGASAVSILVAWVYIRFDAATIQGRVFFLLVLLPIVALRHIYVKLNTLQGLYDQLDAAHDKLEVALREQLEMMVRSIEARDPYTSGHSRRVAALSRAIGTDLGLSGEELAQVENAALLHDVGKIHAEFAPLLQKEGRLTQEEWEVMKTHAVKSAELVSLFSRFRGAVERSVRFHHERWDGKGYPGGLVGESIPLGARIIMISDTIDAMTTDRPYRKALPFDKVVAELNKYRATQFDPMLVEVTVGSVTVRRLVSDKVFLAEQTANRQPSLARPRPALRSQSSFFDAVRAGGASRETS
jgi:hypothetical protein